MTDDLSQLSPAETDVLRLLAAGHTVKSIAVMLGRSEGSINERLREARRKTGAASSRELARRVAAQENRDRFIDVAPLPTEAPPASTPNPASRRTWWTGGAMMFAAIIMAGALALGGGPVANHETSGPAVSVNYQTNDPDLTGFTFTSEHPDLPLYEQEFQSQPRNDTWAIPAEHLLSRYFGPVAARYNLTGHMSIHCRSTLCRVVARYTGMSPDKMPKMRIHQVQNVFRHTQLNKTFANARLQAEYTGDWSGDPSGEERFAIYFRQHGASLPAANPRR